MNEDINEILMEYARACKLWPDWPTDQVHAAAIVAEECGELVRAVNDKYMHKKPGKHGVREEAIQTAAMALRFLANLDKRIE